jgi:hypothetical protein
MDFDKLQKQLSFWSFISLASYYFHEAIFCYHRGIPLDLISFNLVRAFGLVVSSLFIVFIIYSACYIFMNILTSFITLKPPSESMEEISVALRLFPLCIFSIYLFHLGIRETDLVDGVLGIPIFGILSNYYFGALIGTAIIYILCILYFSIYRISVLIQHSSIYNYYKKLSKLYKWITKVNLFPFLIAFSIPIYLFSIIGFATSSKLFTISNNGAFVVHENKEYKILRIYDDIIIADHDGILNYFNKEWLAATTIVKNKVTNK